MRSAGWWSGAVACLAMMTGAATLLVDRGARAADHVDPPARTDPAAVGTLADVAADIADVYFFHGNGTAKLIITNAGPRAPGLAPVYDSNVVYVLHLSNDGNVATDEATIDVRYGRDAAGNWGVRLAGVPGTTQPIVGAVQTTLTSGSVRAIAGLFDDPFFFDVEGFRDTRATGNLMIRNDRNFFAGKNDTSVSIEFPTSAIANGTNVVTAWARIAPYRGSLIMTKTANLLACLALVGLAGCGGGGGGSVTATTPTTPTATNPPSGTQTTASVDVTPCLNQMVAPGKSVASLVVPDVVSLNLNAPAGFPNGRFPIDPVVDIELSVLLLDLTKTGADTLVKLPLNPPASSGNTLPYAPSFPYLQVANGGAPVATGGSGFAFRTEAASAFTRVDRMGQPAVATALVRSPSKTAYNDDSPAQDATGKWAPEFTADLTELTSALLDDLKPTGLPLCAKVS